MSQASPPPAKRPRVQYHRHHVLLHKSQQIPPAEPALIEQEALDRLLIGSLKSICEEQAFRLDIIDPSIESVALEALRNITEEHILKLCMTVRRSMLAARRTVPIPPDFESVAQALDKQIPKSELKPYLTEPDINPPLLPTPPPEDVFHDRIELPSDVLGPELDGEAQKMKDKYIPSTLPPLPSSHTYKATAVYPIRETDPRRIRELATEEGKTGEQALRKLAGAMKLEKTISTELEVSEPAAVLRMPKARHRKKPAISEEALFEETMRDLLAAESPEGKDAFEVGPVVSFEKRFWRPDDTTVKRRVVGAAKGKQRAPDGDGDVAFEL